MEFTEIALLEFCDLLIWEMKSLGNEDGLIELSEAISKLNQLADKNNSTALQAQVFLLQSKLSLLNFDFEKTSRSHNRSDATGNKPDR